MLIIFRKPTINSFFSISNDEIYISKDNLNKVIYYERILFDKINLMCGVNYLFSCISSSILNLKYNKEIRLSLYNYKKIIPHLNEYCKMKKNWLI